MIQVSVANSLTGGSWGGTFPDSTTANTWIAQCEAGGLWGNPPVSAATAGYSGTPDGALTSIVITANNSGSAGNVMLSLDGTSTISGLIATWNTANPSNQLTLTSGDGTQIPNSGYIYLLNGQNAQAGYVVTSTDVTAQANLQASIAKGLQCQTFGATIIAQVYAYNEANLGSGALTSGQFTAMLADTTIANIERLLSNGSLSTALSLINSYTATLETYFSSAQVSAITTAISGSGLI